MSTATAPPPRLKTRYLDEIRPALVERFGYSSVMQAPRIQKITVNMGVGLAKQDSKMLKAARDQLATIAGQQPSVRRARKSIAAFKLREGMPVGVAVTLRSARGYEFLDRLVSIAIPRIRDFRGLNPRSFDGRGNYSLGVHEQIIFPEIDYDAIDQVRGLDITITTTAATDAEAFALLLALGMPFAAQGRPRGFNEAAGLPPAEDTGADNGGGTARASTREAPATDEAPVADDSAAEEAAADEPAADEPAAETPVADEPVEEAADETQTAEEPAAEAPTVEEPAADVPAAEPPTAEAPVTDDSETAPAGDDGEQPAAEASAAEGGDAPELQDAAEQDDDTAKQDDADKDKESD